VARPCQAWATLLGLGRGQVHRGNQDRNEPGLPGPLQDILPVFVERVEIEMGVGIHQGRLPAHEDIIVRPDLVARSAMALGDFQFLPRLQGLVHLAQRNVVGSVSPAWVT